MDKGLNAFFLYVCLTWVMSAWPTEALGQAKNVTITVYQKHAGGAKKKPLGGQTVYGFFSASKANSFVAKLEKAGKEKGIEYLGSDEGDVYGKTNDEGFVTLQLPATGYVVVAPLGASPKKEPVKGRLAIDIDVEDSRSLDEVSVSEKARGIIIRPPKSCGNRLVFQFDFPLFADQVDVKSRIMVKPLVTVIETGDTLGYLAPFVKDGVEFDKALFRRMSFDRMRDPLYPYRVGLMRESHKADTLPIAFELYPINRKFHYKVTADMMYAMSMKTPYRVDSICLAEGYVRDPMRFLDFDIIQVPIDRKLYEREGKASLSKDHSKLFLNFLVGKAELDPSDSTNAIQLQQLKQTLARYSGADAGITGAVIHGSASPEGGVATNGKLCRERAEFLRSALKSFPALRDAFAAGEVKTTAQVATWEKVADMLNSDSLTNEAAMVRSVLQLTKDVRRQEEQIRKLPCWETIEKRILPKFRYVDIEYNYYTNRVKTREEVMKEYREVPEYNAGKRQKPYEFYILLDMLKDLKEKEPIAKAAYETVKDLGGERAWPLAAYELAQCYLSRGHVDTMLLKPYLDISKDRKGAFQKYDWTTERAVEWYNDPAILTMHINMLCKLGDFNKAYIYAYFLPEEQKYQKLRTFIRCLNCEWDVPEVMDTVSNSSYWNKIVVTAAQTDAANRETALFMLDDTSKVNQADPKVLYMKAQLLFDLYGKIWKSTQGYNDANFMRDENFAPLADDPYHDSYGYALSDWGLPMAQCCAIDEKYVDIMLFDGEFNEDYRKAFKAYWKKVKSGELPRPELPVPTAQGSKKNELEGEQDLPDEVFDLEE